MVECASKESGPLFKSWRGGPNNSPEVDPLQMCDVDHLLTYEHALRGNIQQKDWFVLINYLPSTQKKLKLKVKTVLCNIIAGDLLLSLCYSLWSTLCLHLLIIWNLEGCFWCRLWGRFGVSNAHYFLRKLLVMIFLPFFIIDVHSSWLSSLILNEAREHHRETMVNKSGEWFNAFQEFEGTRPTRVFSCM